MPCSRRRLGSAEKALVRRERVEWAARLDGAADVRFGPPSTPSSWLERIVPPGELLFSHAVHGAMAGPGTGSLCSSALRTRMDFVTWADAEAAQHGLPGEVIPPDPHAAVGTPTLPPNPGLARGPPPGRARRPGHPGSLRARTSGHPVCTVTAQQRMDVAWPPHRLCATAWHTAMHLVCVEAHPHERVRRRGYLLHRPRARAHHTDQLLAGIDVPLPDPISSGARTPVEIQSATRIRSRWEGGAANSSLNQSVGIEPRDPLRRWGR